MLQQTVEHLQARGFLRGEEQVDRDKLALALLGLLKEQPVAGDEEIEQKALIVSELRFRVLGEPTDEQVESELDQIVAQLTGPRGKVQDKLENGAVLCSAPVTRKLSNGGENVMTLKRFGRFLTENAELIERFYLLPAQERIVTAVKGFNGRLELAVKRQPQIETRRQPLVAKTYEQVALEMPRELQPA